MDRQREIDRLGLSPRAVAEIAALVALSVVLSPLLSIPIGPFRAYPVQHLVNVLTAVRLGPGAAVLQAATASTLRLALGTGTIFAYPGSLFGAWLAGVLYRRFQHFVVAAFGEAIGTGFVGATVAYGLGRLIASREVALLGFVGPFLLSSALGAAGGVVLLLALRRTGLLGGETLSRFDAAPPPGADE
ncbi:MAG: energy coupling factor transporter S component ThiW [Hydrogenibacillus schlegelii]|uniref:Energy coupling factor transporter S component ThiW n=1 Tax=Hydrogenibacillus schlegelii TaxID=1484 RepID=A0A947G9I0_HYDSH|nr:energy coupling factor transporter S component ThiW [Hydrogenibacillus schlegelii]